MNKSKYPICEALGLTKLPGEPGDTLVSFYEVEQAINNKATTAYGNGSLDAGCFAYGGGVTAKGFEKKCLVLMIEDTGEVTAEDLAGQIKNLMPTAYQSAESVQRLGELAAKLAKKVLRE